MAIKEPMTAAEYKKKYGVPVNFNMPEDQLVKAAHGFQTSIFSPAEPSFEAASKKAKGGNMVTRLLGLNEASDVFGAHIARNPLGAALTGGNVDASQEFIEKPTAGQTAGAVLQAGAAIASPAIAPISMPGMMVAGGALGYSYDVGSDMIAQESLGKTLTPGIATAAGVIAPPVLSKAIGVSAGVASLIGRSATQQVPRLTRGLGALGEGVANVARQGADETASRIGRAFSHGAESVSDVAEKAVKMKKAPANARPAIRTGIEDEVIELATKSNPQTREAMREMVAMAEQGTGKAGTGPGRVAADKAVEQLHLIEGAKRDIGAKIGEASRNLPQAQSIDMSRTLQTLDDVLSQNGIIRQADGSFTYTNKGITPEQKKVIENLHKLATEDSVLSAQQIHQMDQLFSKLQRQSNVIDKVDNIFLEVPGPDGQTKTNLFKVFRDVFGQQLDELSPDMRALNSDYRKLTNLVDDIESSIAKTPGFESLPMNDNYAEAGLRQLFSRGQKADQMVDLYEIMDSTSRSLGYQGARADDLYSFALELNKIYPDNVPPTSFEGNIMSAAGQIFRKLTQAGKVTPKDQQKALSKLLEETN
jgi:hypothetical protein